MHEIARPGNLALLNITGYQAQALQCLYSSGAPVWLGHMECDRSVKTASLCFWPGFLANTTAPPQAVWAYSSGCSLRGPLNVRHEHTPIASLLIGVAQEADPISPVFEQ